MSTHRVVQLWTCPQFSQIQSASAAAFANTSSPVLSRFPPLTASLAPFNCCRLYTNPFWQHIIKIIIIIIIITRVIHCIETGNILKAFRPVRQPFTTRVFEFWSTLSRQRSRRPTQTTNRTSHVRVTFICWPQRSKLCPKSWAEIRSCDESSFHTFHSRKCRLRGKLWTHYKYLHTFYALTADQKYETKFVCILQTWCNPCSFYILLSTSINRPFDQCALSTDFYSLS